MAIDRVRPIKQESAATGGDPADDVEFLQAPVQSNEDAIDVRGVYLQNDTSNNTAALITRDSSDNITLTDPNAGTYTLSQLAAGGAGLTANQHRNLLQLIHFIDEGPAEGFVTGATKTVTGTVFPTSVICLVPSNGENKVVPSKLVTLTGFPGSKFCNILSVSIELGWGVTTFP
jgi:hypothetical protein